MNMPRRPFGETHARGRAYRRPSDTIDRRACRLRTRFRGRGSLTRFVAVCTEWGAAPQAHAESSARGRVGLCLQRAGIMNVLVTGGAGYIGSHMVRRLMASGHHVVVVDDLSAGHRASVDARAHLIVADVRDRTKVVKAMRDHQITAVMHFASRIQVSESVTDPRLYYRNNVACGIELLESVLEARVAHFILSSTAAVYGVPLSTPIAEDHPTLPVNPYGETKLVLEHMLRAYEAAYGLSYVALRYFNAAGAAKEGDLGEAHTPETHLIPLVLAAALEPDRQVTVFGNDYDTDDGTCVRDYIHVLDLADAHLAALEHLVRGGPSGAFNLGTGVGHSVARVVEIARKVTGADLRVVHAARRSGDPSHLVAGVERAGRILGWKAQRPSLEEIIGDAWRWHRRRAREIHRMHSTSGT